MDNTQDHDHALVEDDSLLVRKRWWNSSISSFAGNSVAFVEGSAEATHEVDNDPLSPDLPGVRFAQEVLSFYESKVGMRAGPQSGQPAPFTLASPVLPTPANSEDIDHINRTSWNELTSAFEEDDALVSPSMSSSITTHRSTSVDLTSDSGRSAVYSSMPSTPKAADSQVLPKDSASPCGVNSLDPPARDGSPSDHRSPSPQLCFQFPSLNTPSFEITRDAEGFIVSRSESKENLGQSNSLLPPFLTQSSPKPKTVPRSKTRSIVDKLRSSSRDASDDSCDDSSSPSVHDLSFIKPRLGASDLDDDEGGTDGGWIGSPINTDSSTSSVSESMMARANRARALFLTLRKSTQLLSTGATSKSKGKVKASDELRTKSPPVIRSHQEVPQDKEGWIEYPSLDISRAKLSSTKDTMAHSLPSRSKKPNTNNMQGHSSSHRRATSHLPPGPQPALGHPPSTSGTFVFPPPPPPPRPPLPPPLQQWPIPLAPHPPPLSMFPAPPGPYFHNRATSMPLLRPPTQGPWMVGHPPPPLATPIHAFHPQHQGNPPSSHHMVA